MPLILDVSAMHDETRDKSLASASPSQHDPPNAICTVEKFELELWSCCICDTSYPSFIFPGCVIPQCHDHQRCGSCKTSMMFLGEDAANRYRQKFSKHACAVRGELNTSKWANFAGNTTGLNNEPANHHVKQRARLQIFKELLPPEYGHVPKAQYVPQDDGLATYHKFRDKAFLILKKLIREAKSPARSHQFTKFVSNVANISEVIDLGFSTLQDFFSGKDPPDLKSLYCMLHISSAMSQYNAEVCKPAASMTGAQHARFVSSWKESLPAVSVGGLNEKELFEELRKVMWVEIKEGVSFVTEAYVFMRGERDQCLDAQTEMADSRARVSEKDTPSSVNRNILEPPAVKLEKLSSRRSLFLDISEKPSLKRTRESEPPIPEEPDAENPVMHRAKKVCLGVQNVQDGFSISFFQPHGRARRKFSKKGPFDSRSRS